MADLKGQQLKDRYQTLLTTSATTANPTTGTLQNGDGSNITELSIGGSLGVTGGANLATSSGNVGIGTSSPAEKLHVAGVGSAICFDTTGDSGSSIIQTVSDFKLSLKNNRGTSSEIIVGNENLEFSTNSTERMRITSAGNVGIGTDSPAYKLSIQGSGGIEESEEYFYFHSSAVVGSNARAKIRAVGSGGGSGFGGDLRISTRTQANVWNEDAVVVDSGGNVGIGTSSPATKLDVSGAIRASTGILFGTDTSAANTLSDYEEGTWTPSISGSVSAPTGISYTTRIGYYVKIGKMVQLQFQCSGTITGKGSGNILLTGTPFNPGSIDFLAANSGSLGYMPLNAFAIVEPSETRLQFGFNSPGGSAAINWSNPDVSASNFVIALTITYRIL